MQNTYLSHGNITLEILGDENGVSNIHFVKKEKHQEVPICLLRARNQLQEYFDGKRKTFDVPLNISGTDFQKKVWSALQKIPYGQSCSYLDIAKAIKNPKAVRAVGGANNKNKIPIIIPCHRVLGKDGSLVGFAGGLGVKLELLDLEKAYK